MSRYRRSRNEPSVTKVRFVTPSGRFGGVGTKVTFPDGYEVTFIGLVSRRDAIRNAEYQRGKESS